jgi:cell division protein FtsZ
MSNLSRGAKPAPAQESEDEEGGSINIPRFLGRQNNQ